MLGLRLDEPLALDGLAEALDEGEVHRLGRHGLLREEAGTLVLSRRGRMVANDVTACLLAL
jgi:coproporphyrinogen III oxidase-like Fe-S oxidoreductase